MNAMTCIEISRKMRFVALSTLALFSSSAFAIGSGQVVTTDQFEARSAVIILLTRTNPDGSATIVDNCSGVLVSSNLVMTAAHCTNNMVPSTDAAGHVTFQNLGTLSPRNVFVYFSIDFSPTAINISLVRAAEAVRSYPGFWEQAGPDVGIQRRDLGLIKLLQSAPSSYQPASVLNNPGFLKPGQDVTIAGSGNKYGLNDPREPAIASLSSFETLINNPIDNLVDSKGLIQLYKSQSLPRFKKSFASGSEDEKRAISEAGEESGDSGGPAFVLVKNQPVVVGIASGYDNQNFPVYENVAGDYEWIVKTVGEIGAAPINFLSGNR